MDLETLKTKIEQGDIDGVKDFIKNHPDSINKPMTFGMTALMLAIRKGKTDIFKLLLNNVADVNTRHMWDGFTALHLAVEWNHREDVEELLKHPTIQVNLEDDSGQTPLHWACSKGYKDIVGLFLSHIGIKPNVVDQNGDTPLHVAVQSQNYDVVTLMLSQESLNLEIRNNKNWTPLLEAVSRGHLGIMQKVIARGANVNVVDNEGNNCLHLALTRQRKLFYSEVEHMDILDKCCEDLKLGKKERRSQVVVACYLAYHGAGFYCKNKSGETPLDLIEKGNVKETLMTLFPHCVFCEDEDATETFLPCKHLSLCKKCCFQKIPKRCLKCGRNITSKTSLVGPNSSKMEVQMVAEPVVSPKFEDKGVQSDSQLLEATNQQGGSSELKEKDLLRVAKRLGSDWWQVAIYLGIETTELKMDDESIDTVKQGYLMLYEWFRRCDPETRTHATLSAALEEAECFTALECLSLDAK